MQKEATIATNKRLISDPSHLETVLANFGIFIPHPIQLSQLIAPCHGANSVFDVLFKLGNCLNIVIG